jgi:hypothetical protein
VAFLGTPGHGAVEYAPVSVDFGAEILEGCAFVGFERMTVGVESGAGFVFQLGEARDLGLSAAGIGGKQKIADVSAR